MGELRRKNRLNIFSALFCDWFYFANSVAILLCTMHHRAQKATLQKDPIQKVQSLVNHSVRSPITTHHSRVLIIRFEDRRCFKISVDSPWSLDSVKGARSGEEEWDMRCKRMNDLRRGGDMTSFFCTNSYRFVYLRVSFTLSSIIEVQVTKHCQSPIHLLLSF